MKDIKLLFSLVMLMAVMGASAQTTWITAGESFTDGTLVYWIKNYPNGYKRAAEVDESNAHLLGQTTYYNGKGELNSDEVAVSLLRNETLTVTDTIAITGSIVTSKYASTLATLTTWYDYTNRNTFLTSTAYGTNKTIAEEKDYENGRTDSVTTIDGIQYTYLCVSGSPRISTFSKYMPQNKADWLKGTSKRVANLEITQTNARYYKREGIKVQGSTKSSVHIPATVTSPDGVVYKVGIIAHSGFIYNKTTFHSTPRCEGGEGTYQWGDVVYNMDGGNDYLQNVTFDANSNIRLIKEFAFAGCSKLKSITIPNSVETIGTSAFCYNRSLASVTFQTYPNSNESALRTIDGYAFRGCERIASLSFPEGLTTIGNMALMWNITLKSCVLPNTLTSVGTHFLCCAMQLKTVTIPAALVNLDGALFHGCESLEEIYMLGMATNLKNVAEDNYTTFDENQQYCASAVDKDNVKLYVPSTYLGDYQSHPVWKQLANIEETPGAYRDFTGGKWVTAAFPKGVSNYKSVFGQDSKCAVMTSAKREKEWVQDPQTGKAIVMYTLNFELISGANIPEDKPVLLFPQNTVRHQMWASTDETAAFIADMTQNHAYGVDAKNDEDTEHSDLDAYITMNSQYVPYKMNVWDFYLTTKDGKQTFRRVPSVDKAATVGATRCYWTVRVNGLPAETTVNDAHEAFFYDDTDAVTRIVVDGEELGIYDLQGRRLSIPARGINIVNGKKIFIK